MSIHIVANLTARGLKHVAPKSRAEGDRGVSSRHEALRQAALRRATIHETSSVDELAPLLRDILRSDCDFLILAGGDGTFMSGATALARAHREAPGRPLPTLALLPLGTVGTIARNFGPRAPVDRLLHAWLHEPERARVVPRPTLRVRSFVDDRVEERIGFIVGTGLVAQFFEEYEARGAGGTRAAARIVARVFVESFRGGPLATRILTPTPVALSVDGQRRQNEGVSLFLASVVRDLGLSMQVCYRAGEHPTRFHVVASSLPPKELGPRAPLVMLGRRIGGHLHVDELASEVELAFTRGQGRFVLDGDLFRADRFTVTAGPILPIVGPSL